MFNNNSLKRIAQFLGEPTMDEIPELFSVASSNISAIGYQEYEGSDLGTLYVQFLRKGNDFAERLYKYENVPFDVYSEMTFGADSIGSYFYHNVRNNPNYPYERIF
jgi:hypothetical protein